jgi:hypothetical protein
MLSANRAVCSAYPPPKLALCITGEPPSAPRAAANVFASISTNVGAALGIRPTTFVLLTRNVPSEHNWAVVEAAARLYLQPKALVIKNESGGRDEVDRRSRLACFEQIAQWEQQEGKQFASILNVPADELWIFPMWPYCMQELRQSRQYGRVWWVPRSDMAAAFTAAGGSRPRLVVDHALRSTVRLCPKLTPNVSLTDLVCSQWDEVMQPHMEARLHVDRQAQHRRPPCPLRNYTAISGDGICIGTDVQPPRIALCLGGLARTFGHSLAFKTLKGNLLIPLRAKTSAVFAHLRLADSRGIPNRGRQFANHISPGTWGSYRQNDANRATMGMVASNRSDVERALRYLGALEDDVRILDGAQAPVPQCPGQGGVYDADRGSQPWNACQGYFLPCSQHVIDGMLTSRVALYDLVVAHERRRQIRFDFVIFCRPDVAVLLPVLPWCFYGSDVARHNQDWFEWLPRALAEGALSAVAKEYYSCATPGFDKITDYVRVAAKHGTRLVQDDTLRVVTILRDNRPGFPHKKDCGELATGLLAAARARSGDYSTMLTGSSPGPVVRAMAGMLAPACLRSSTCMLIEACLNLTFGNPENTRRENYTLPHLFRSNWVPCNQRHAFQLPKCGLE